MAEEDRKTEVSTRLLAGSFRGVPFYVDGASVAGGRKANERPIINSDEQVVDDVGLKQRSYAVRGYVAARYDKKIAGSEFGISSDYDQERDALLAALEKREPALLVHPIEGDIPNVVAKSWTLDESLTEAGIGRLSIEFVKETTIPVPVAETGKKEDVIGAVEDVKAAMTAIVAEQYEIDLGFVGAFFDALDKMNAVYDQVQEMADFVESAADKIGEFTQFVNDAVDTVSSIITAPIAIADAVQGAIKSVNSIFSTFAGKFKAMTNAFKFGDFDLEFDFSTPSGKQKKRNFDALNLAVQGTALAFAYDAATELDYVTVDDIELIEEILEDQHQKMIGTGNLTDEATESLILLREAFFLFLADAKVAARKVITETVTETTPRVLAYSLYESDELAASLAGLNSVETYQLLGGELQVLSE